MEAQRTHDRGRGRLLFASWVGPLGLVCSGCQGVLGPQTGDARRVAALWWLSLGISVVLFVAIIGLLAYALFHKRGARPRLLDRDPRTATAFILVLGVAVPLVILSGVFAYSVGVTAVNAQNKDNTLRIDVIGHNWWWEFRYPDQGFTAVNTLHVPVGRPVELHITTADVIHSFWVPKLNGKTDAVPGLVNNLNFTARGAGTYRGVCAEFCGRGHACMDFPAVAEQTEQFDDWVRAVKQIPLKTPDDAHVAFMLEQCFDERNVPVCMPAGCQQAPNAILRSASE